MKSLNYVLVCFGFGYLFDFFVVFVSTSREWFLSVEFKLIITFKVDVLGEKVFI